MFLNKSEKIGPSTAEYNEVRNNKTEVKCTSAEGGSQS